MGLREADIIHGLPLFAFDDVTGHAEVHDRDIVYLHVTKVALASCHADVDTIQILNLYVTSVT